VVAGGGLAGLAAALELEAAGARVQLLERARLLGGRATSFTVEGEEVDNGQHVFLACCTEFVDLARRLGLGERLHLQERFDALLLPPGRRPARLRAAALPAPWHLALALAGYAELGWADRLRVARALLALERLRGGGEEPLAAWLDRRGQSPASRRAFWEPFFVPALNAPLEEVPVAEAAFVVATAFTADAGAARFGWLTVPLARLAEAAAARLDAVHTRTPVVGLELGWGGEVRAVRTPEGTLACDAVVLALPPNRLPRVLGDPERFGLGAVRDFVARPIVDVHLWHDAGRLGFGFAALLEAPVQWVFEKAPGYLCCSLSNAGALVHRPEAELVRDCWEVVAQRLPGLEGASLRRGAATRNPEATYAPAPGVRRPGPATRVPNLALAGSWTATGWPDTMESAVRSGRAAARLLAARWRATAGAVPSPDAEDRGRARGGIAVG